jgi:hypothetical protein
MDAPLTLDELRTAVGDLTAALLDHQPLTDRQWDNAVTTLHIAREQHGGRIRRLIHTILDAGRPDRPVDQLPDALSELHCHLAVADNPPASGPPPDKGANRRRGTTRRRGESPTQLSLFAAAEPDPAPRHEGAGGRVATDSPTRQPPLRQLGRKPLDVTTFEDRRPT